MTHRVISHEEAVQEIERNLAEMRKRHGSTLNSEPSIKLTIEEQVKQEVKKSSLLRWLKLIVASGFMVVLIWYLF